MKRPFDFEVTAMLGLKIYKTACVRDERLFLSLKFGLNVILLSVVCSLNSMSAYVWTHK